MGSPPPFAPLGRSIGRTSKLVRAWGDRQLTDLDSSVTEWIVLFNIANAPDPGASQAEIARFSDMGGPALVRHIDRLEADGLVARKRDATDRRAIRLTLTPAGHDRLDQLRVVMARCDAQMRAVLSKEEAAVMQQALDKLFEFCLGEMHGGCPPGSTDLTGPPRGGLRPSPRPRARSKR
jgi:MarR family transcriptional regulator, transcriptional regulator for hemolysin